MYYVFTEYVDDLTAVLLTTTKDDLLKVRQDMSKNIPEQQISSQKEELEKLQ